MDGASSNPFFDTEPGGREAAPGPLALVQAFVNTVAEEGGRRWEAFGEPDALRSWLAGMGLLSGEETVGDADFDLVLEVRGALRALVASNNGGEAAPATAVATLDGAAERSHLSLRFRESGGASLAPTAGGVDGALGAVLAAAYDATRDGTWARLKACRRCSWAFYDRSKNRSGAWCSMGVCGNRVKTRAYRRRRSGTDA